MISALAFVPRGAAKHVPDKYEVTEQDLEKWRTEIGEKKYQSFVQRAGAPGGGDDDDEEPMDGDGDENGGASSSGKTSRRAAQRNLPPRDADLGDDDVVKMFNLDKYDEEDEDADDALAMAGDGLNLYFGGDDDDPNLANLPDEDSEEIDDYVIEADDVLILAAKHEEDVSNLEVYVYEEKENNLFVHHDLLLPALPLCIAWMNHDFKRTGHAGNFVAVGTFEPSIEIWDLDVLDVPEPICVLGGEKQLSRADKKKMRKKGKKAKKEFLPGSHTDSVMSLSWNSHYRQLLASGSADCTVKLWDLENATCERTLTHHTGKVQSVEWNPSEHSILLTGGFDRNVCVLDPRDPTSVARWSVTSDVEALSWNPHRPEQFLVSTEDGFVHACDARKPDQVLYSIQAHSGPVSSVSFSPRVPGLLLTVSNDKYAKLWDLRSDQPSCMVSRNLGMDALFTASFCPDTPFTLACGGAKGTLLVWNTLEVAVVRDRFSEYVTPEMLSTLPAAGQAIASLNTGDMDDEDVDSIDGDGDGDGDE